MSTKCTIRESFINKSLNYRRDNQLNLRRLQQKLNMTMNLNNQNFNGTISQRYLSNLEI